MAVFYEEFKIEKLFMSEYEEDILEIMFDDMDDDEIDDAIEM